MGGCSSFEVCGLECNEFYEPGQDVASDEWFDLYDRIINGMVFTFDRDVIQNAPGYIAARVKKRLTVDINQRKAVLSAWKRYHFQQIIYPLKELDDVFYSLSKGADAIPESAVGRLGQELGKDIPARSAFFIMAQLALGGKGRADAFLRTASPSDIRDRFQVDNWALPLSLRTWRRWWLRMLTGDCDGLWTASLHEARRRAWQMHKQFASAAVGSDEMVLCLKFMFFLSKNEYEGLSREKAADYSTLFLSSKWALTDKWNQFMLHVWNKPVITHDQWVQLPHFASEYPSMKALLKFNAESSHWSSLMDAFALHMRQEHIRNE